MAWSKGTILLMLLPLQLLLVNYGSSQGYGNQYSLTTNKFSFRETENRRPVKNAPCFRKREMISKMVHKLPYVRMPNCENNGLFSPKQCNHKYCWCSDPMGNIISGTVRMASDYFECGSQVPSKPCAIEYLRVMSSRTRPNSVPRCDKDGYYLPHQCSHKYKKFCWCVDKHGEVMRNTQKIGLTSCDAFTEANTLSGPTKRRFCLLQRREALGISLSRKPFVPQCRADGSFVPIQCNVYRGYCWCVDYQGKEISGTRTDRTPNCMSRNTDKMPATPCHMHRTYIHYLPDNHKIHLPKCEKGGLYQIIQCSRNHQICWCVDSYGKEIDYTVVPRRSGPPRCPNSREAVTNDTFLASTTPPCHRHEAKMKRIVLNRVLQSRNIWHPRCDENGFYTATQCNTRYCWCTDHNGNMIAGTARSAKKLNAECVTSRKNCVEERNTALLEPLSKKPFIPQCRSDGKYAPLQCDTYDGSCWCTDKNGKEIVGSKTKRTPNCFSNVLNEIEQGPCSLLANHITKLSATQNVYKPECDKHGFFLPAQCSKTTRNRKYCWCVMADGTEVMGSLRFGWPKCDQKERRAPAVPKVRGPCDEHVFRLENLAIRREVYTPVCDEKGFYLSRQCNNGTGSCWCVDQYGAPIHGTKTNKDDVVCDVKPLSPCTAAKKEDNGGVSGGTEAACTSDGYYAVLQCNVNTGKCWCVDKYGTMIHGTSLYARPYCGNDDRICENKRRSLLLSEEGKQEAVLPSCDLHGFFNPVQCNHLHGECFCADRFGNETSGTRTKGIPNCGQLPRPCDEHASRSAVYDFIFGVFVPQCDAEGYYETVQCHELTDTCWCSSKVGVEIPGTMTSGEPKCTM